MPGPTLASREGNLLVSPAAKPSAHLAPALTIDKRFITL